MDRGVQLYVGWTVGCIQEVVNAALRRGDHALMVPRQPELEKLRRTWLGVTSKQRQVLALLACGLDNQRLATLMGISERAVKAHVSALLDKFKADTRTELAVMACDARLHRPRECTSWIMALDTPT